MDVNHKAEDEVGLEVEALVGHVVGLAELEAGLSGPGSRYTLSLLGNGYFGRLQIQDKGGDRQARGRERRKERERAGEREDKKR